MIDYNQELSNIIKKNIVVLGPDIVFAKAESIPGLILNPDGTVKESKTPPQEAMQLFKEQLEQFTGQKPLIDPADAAKKPIAQVQ